MLPSVGTLSDSHWRREIWEFLLGRKGELEASGEKGGASEVQTQSWVTKDPGSGVLRGCEQARSPNSTIFAGFRGYISAFQARAAWKATLPIGLRAHHLPALKSCAAWEKSDRSCVVSGFGLFAPRHASSNTCTISSHVGCRPGRRIPDSQDRPDRCPSSIPIP